MARFPQRARLQKPGDFSAAFERGRRLNERWLAALVLPNEATHPRLGLAVPKKVARRAVDRNRIKRQIRESFRQQQPHLPAVDVVILARGGAVEATAPQLREILDRLWNRVKAQCAPPPSS